MRSRLTGGGVHGNELLTTLTGGVLVLLLAIIGVTIIALRPLLWAHLFVGMLLIGPVALKLASTGYRFVRYYSSHPEYRAKGAPPTPLRAIAPLVVASTLVVFASGVALLIAGPASRDALLPIHKVSFVVWLMLTGIHVLAHLPRTASGLGEEYGALAHLRAPSPGRSGRALSLAGALTAGAVIAVLLIPQFGPWIAHPH